MNFSRHPEKHKNIPSYSIKKPDWLKKNFINKNIKLGANFNTLNIKEPLYNKILNSINFNNLPSAVIKFYEIWN